MRQPHVELILQKKKKYRYGSQPTNIREGACINASMKLAGDGSDWHPVRSEPDLFPTGLIVRSVQIVGCKWDAKPVRLKKHVKTVNQPLQRFWNLRFRRIRNVQRGAYWGT